jgi:hypothetical protein
MPARSNEGYSYLRVLWMQLPRLAYTNLVKVLENFGEREKNIEGKKTADTFRFALEIAKFSAGNYRQRPIKALAIIA